MSKKLIIILSSVIGFLVLLILVIWLITTFKHTYYSYEKVEEKTVEATKKYFKKHPELLPVSDGKYSLSYETLVSEELIKPLTELLKDGDKCSMNIYYTKSDVNYSYYPMLNCGENYETKELYRQVLTNNTVVTSGNGLYQNDNGEYYFRGKVENNYVQFGSYLKLDESRIDLLWRIISINPDNTIKLIAIRRPDERTVYDDRYNVNKDSKVGYNDFELSVLKQFLVKYETKNTLFNDTESALLVPNNLCIAPRKEDDTSKDGSTECATKSSNKMIFSTLLPYEYLRVSTDEYCKSLQDNSCTNYNWLAEDDGSGSWLITANPKDTYHSYSYNLESIETSNTNNQKYVYPVVTINSLALYRGGDGTIENPYLLFKKDAKK